MEVIRGKVSRTMGLIEFQQRIAGYGNILLDLGTGDGRYVHTLARQQSGCFAIGVDACRENLHQYSRIEQANALFVIAEAHSLPHELTGLVSHLTINFPWSSLLQGLLAADPALMEALALVARPAASLEVRLNAGALAEAGTTLEAGAVRVHDNLCRCGWRVDAPRFMQARDLRAFPTTWSLRLAFGRDPRAIQINGWLAR